MTGLIFFVSYFLWKNCDIRDIPKLTYEIGPSLPVTFVEKGDVSSIFIFEWKWAFVSSPVEHLSVSATQISTEQAPILRII